MSEKIHQERCDNDPIYRLLFFPDDQLLNLFLEYMERKYGPLLMDDRIVSKAFSLLKTTDDAQIKKFAVLFILQSEKELNGEVAQMYGPDGLFDKNRNYRRLLSKLDEFTEMTLNFPYNRHNIIRIVDNFLSATVNEYTMGPLK